MPAYLIIRTEILDEPRYREYMEKAKPLVEQYGGRYLARGGDTKPISGEWKPERLTLIEFPSEGHARRCLSSPAYGLLGQIRKAAARTRALLTEGCAAEPGELARRNRVVLLTDVHSFSIVGVELGTRLPEFVQTYLDRMGEEITRHGGLIIKYIGDSLLALFGDGEEENAVVCAVRMRCEYQNLANRYGVTTETELEVGISSGDVFVGSIGHPSLVVRDIMGETVYEAGRLMHHRGIAVTGRVRRSLGERFTLSRLEDVNVKWSETPLEVWEVVEETI
jgi:uncharacterized protein (DUF1330 family)